MYIGLMFPVCQLVSVLPFNSAAWLMILPFYVILVGSRVYVPDGANPVGFRALGLGLNRNVFGDIKEASVAFIFWRPVGGV